MILTAHYVVGSLVLLLALLAIFWPWARRAVQWTILVQVVLGALVWSTTKLTPNIVHWVLPLFVAGAYPAARRMEAQGRPAGSARFVLIVAFVLIAVVFYLGEHALHAK